MPGSGEAGAMPSAEEILGRVRDTMRVEQVFGQPYERDGVTIIPVARVVGGGGAGGGAGGPGASKGSGSAEGAERGPAAGSGWGFGASAAPAGVYVIRDGIVSWEPAVDRNRVIFLAGMVTLVSVWAFRSILVTLIKRL
jgi:uncharacterized spore protein YtfJ